MDVKGSTLLKRDAPDEAIRASFAAYHDLVERAVRGAGGSVVSVAGDGVLARFASDDAAVEAAFAMQREVDGLNRTRNLLAFPFRLRIGIACGTVPGGDISGRTADFLLDAATRLQETCPVGMVLVAWETYGHLERHRDDFSYLRYDEVLRKEVFVNRALPHWTVEAAPGLPSFEEGYERLERADWAGAEAAFRRALSEAEAAGDERRTAAVLHALAYALGRQRKNEAKIPLCLRQIRLERRGGGRRGLETAYRNLYYAYYWLARDREREGRHEEALRLYRKARTAASRIGDARLVKEAERQRADLVAYLSYRKSAPQ